MKNKELSYLDSASTTKIDDRVLDKMLPFFTEYYGNASSNHKFGEFARKAIDNARNQVAKIINCKSNEIIFTSGATEAINMAIKGYAEFNLDKGNHFITTKTEHKAVLATCEYLETKGYEVTYLDVDENGLISLDQLSESIKDTTLLAAIMYVNNETGVIQPIEKIGKICNDRNVAFFCDATQAVGKVKVDVEEDKIDMLCFSGHKINGPKGIGVLYKKESIEITPLIHGGGQENGLRGGTYNTPLIVGLGKACEIAIVEFDDTMKKLKDLNNYLLNTISKKVQTIEISEERYRNFNIINLMIEGLDSDVFISMNKSLSLSNGSACNSEIIEHSHVIKAINKKVNLRNNYLRISLDKFSTKEHIDHFIFQLLNYLNK